MREQPLNGALVGAGRVSQFHLTAWSEIPEARICAIADPDLESAHARAAEFNIPAERVYASLEELLNAETRLDFVDLATPPNTHLELVRIAAARRLAINCQKPFAMSLIEAREMIRISAGAGVLLNINENWRWRSWYREIHALIQEGQIGRPVYARFFLHSDNLAKMTTGELVSHSFYRRSHGVLMEWGIHHIDLIRFLFGEPSNVYMRASTLHPAKSPNEERAIVLLNYPALTTILDMSISSYAPRGDANHNGPMVEDVRIEGERGTILLVPDRDRGDRLRLSTQDGNLDRPAYTGSPQRAYQHSYTEAIRHFVHGLWTGARTETAAQDNLITLAITLAAYESGRQGRVVDIQSFIESQMR
jgi:predicted dehydrogenase